MADNIAVTPGSGATVAADDIGGVLHQRVKISLGADGSAVDAVAGAGAVGTGVQRVTLASDDPAVVALQIIDDWDSSDACKVVGNVAHDSVDSGNPQKIGGVAKTSNPVAVADGDRVNALFDKLGKQVCVGAIRDLKGVQQTTITSSTSETTIVTAAASTFHDLYGLILTNTSATACNVTIKDATAGTTRAVIAVPAGDTRGFMLPVDAAIPQATVNNNWTATCSASVASIQVTALYVKNI